VKRLVVGIKERTRCAFWEPEDRQDVYEKERGKHPILKSPTNIFQGGGKDKEAGVAQLDKRKESKYPWKKRERDGEKKGRLSLAKK